MVIKMQLIPSMKKLLLMTLSFFVFSQASLSWARGLIVNGEDVDYASDLARIIVYISTPDENGASQTCTGTFISDEFILTAAHCIAGDKDFMSASFRKPDHRETQEVYSLNITAASKVFLPRLSRFEKIDLGLIRFSGGLPAGAQIALLPETNKVSSQSFDFTAIGYGMTTGIKAELSNNGVGELRYKNVKSNVILPTDNFFTVDQHKNDGGVCFGDSGGPALIKDKKKNKYTIIGVASQVMNTRPIDGQEAPDICKNESKYINTFSMAPYIKYLMERIQKSETE